MSDKLSPRLGTFETAWQPLKTVNSARSVASVTIFELGGCVKGKGRAIQRESIWSAGMSGQFCSVKEIDHGDEMDQIPATRRKMVLKSIRSGHLETYTPMPLLPISIYHFIPRML